MTLVTRVASASLDDSTGMFGLQVTDLIAGQDLDAVAACYIKTSDGMVYMSNATSDVEAAEFVGFTPRAAKEGQPITLYGIGNRFRYGTSLSPGAYFFLAATAGRLDTAVTAGGRTPICFCIDDTDIMCIAGYSSSVNT